MTQEQFHSHPKCHITNDFDVSDFEREEEELEEEDRINDDNSSDSDDFDDDDDDEDEDDQGVTDAVPTSVLHAMPTQGRLVHDLPEEDRPYDSWGRISEAQHYVRPPLYTSTELRQMSDGNMLFTGVPNYMDLACQTWRFVTQVCCCVPNPCITIGNQRSGRVWFSIPCQR